MADSSDCGERFDFDEWADDEAVWDHDTGAPSQRLVSDAIQAWSVLQNRADVSVAEAAAVFNIAPARVIEAVESHAWMYLKGPRADYSRLFIEHDGE